MSPKTVVSYQQYAIKDVLHPRVFNSAAPRGEDTDKEYRIAERNRHFRWSNKDDSCEKLIDSIMRPLPIGCFLVTHERQRDGKLVYDIQDGHHRAAAINQYFNDKFTWKNKKYSELTPAESAKFDHYSVIIQILKRMPGCNDEEWRKECDDAFERINCGKSLNNADKFWNRREEQMPKYILGELKNDGDLRVPFKEIFGDVGGGKTRKYLAEMIALCLVVIKSDITLLNPSYDINAKYIIQAVAKTAVPVNGENKSKVKAFLAWYFALIKDIKEKEGGLKYTPGDFTKTSGILGLVLANWVDGGIQGHRTMWIEYAVVLKKDKNFGKRLFAHLPKGQQQNTEGIQNRVQCVISAYNAATHSFTTTAEEEEEEDEEEGEDDEEEEVDF